MKFKIKAVLTVTAVILGVCACAAKDGGRDTGTSRPPNILLVISDDVGMDVTTGMYPGLIDDLVKKYGPSGHNHPDVGKIDGRPASTPVLDKFARQGMRFSNVWAHPFCSPTRATILTGLFAGKTKVTTYADALSSKHTSFVQILKDRAGYSTAVFGKWHMAGLPGKPVDYPGMKPKQAGFDLFKGNLHAAIASYWDYDYQIQDDQTPADQWRSEPMPVKSLPGIAPTNYAPVVKIADAIEWITAREKENPDKPWFAWLAFNLSHITGNQLPNPMIVPNIDTMDEIAIKEMKECGGTFGSAIVGKCSSEALMRAMTNSMDTIIGKVLAVVDKQDPNTYVIYLGDNGTWMFGEKREFIDNMYITRRGRSKGTAYESGARVSMAIRGPRIPANTQSNVPVNGVDLFATILELAKLDVPKTVPNKAGNGTVNVDSYSLSSILFKGAKSLRDPNTGYMLTETRNPVMNNLKHVGARNLTYKVICADRTDTPSCTFYNLVKDPLEEYPLDKPDSCANYKNGTWTPAKQEWHFCRLQEVIAKESFLSTPDKKSGTAQSKDLSNPNPYAALAD